MKNICLYYGWETCARVTMTALEQIGLPFTVKRLDLSKLEQRSPEYLAINPNAEVPALLFDGHILTQNAAILHYLNATFPAAGLLPPAGGLVKLNEPLQDLMWCSATLHIYRRMVLNPGRMTVAGVENVRLKGLEGWHNQLPRIEKRLGERQWWYGDTWSVVDVYLNWAFSGLMAEKLNIPGRPAIADHEKRLNQHPAYIRALARERGGDAAVPSDFTRFFPPGPAS